MYVPVVNLLASKGIHGLLRESSLVDPELFPAVMTSVGQCWDYRLNESTLSRRMEFYQDWREIYEGRVLIDSGGYKVKKMTDTGSLPAILKTSRTLEDEVMHIQRMLRPHIYFPLDRTNDEKTVENNVLWLRHKFKSSNLFAIIPAQPRIGIRGYIEQLRERTESAGYRLRDFDGFAIGGLVPIWRQRERIIHIVQTASDALYQELGGGFPIIHVLGLTRFDLQWIPAFSFDSLSYLFAAINCRRINPDGSRLHLGLEMLPGEKRIHAAHRLALENLRGLQHQFEHVLQTSPSGPYRTVATRPNDEHDGTDTMPNWMMALFLGGDRGTRWTLDEVLEFPEWQEESIPLTPEPVAVET